MKRVFLLGSIGAGKSTALEFFRSLGAITLSADEIVHDLYQNDKELIQRIGEHFGADVVQDGYVNRQKLASRLLAHPEDVQQLENLVHPKVRAELSVAIDSAKGDVFIYEMPISRPTTDFTLADAVIVLDAPREMRLERIVNRGITRDQAERRIELHPDPYVPSHIPVFQVNNDSDTNKFVTKLSTVWDALLRD